jgi:hypothetical protein
VFDTEAACRTGLSADLEHSEVHCQSEAVRSRRGTRSRSNRRSFRVGPPLRRKVSHLSAQSWKLHLTSAQPLAAYAAASAVADNAADHVAGRGQDCRVVHGAQDLYGSQDQVRLCNNGGLAWLERTRGPVVRYQSDESGSPVGVDRP